MNAEYIQNIRYKLQKRVRRLNSTQSQLYVAVLKQFLCYLDGVPLLSGVLIALAAKHPQAQELAQKVLQGQGLIPDNEEEHAAFAYALLRECAKANNQTVLLTIGRAYRRTGNVADTLSTLNDILLEPLYDYLLRIA